MTSVVSPPVPGPPVPDLTQDRPLYEIIDGQIVELPPMSILASRVASRLMGRLSSFLQMPPSVKL